MELTLQGKDRLEGILLRLDRMGRARKPSIRRHVEVPGWDGGDNGVRRRDRASAPGDPRPSNRPVDLAAEGPGLSPAAAEAIDNLVTRLDILEARVSLLGRPVPASREVFAEWVRLRRHEEMSFGDYLRLRRSGLV